MSTSIARRKSIVSSILSLRYINQTQRAVDFIDACIEKNPRLRWLPHCNLFLTQQVGFILLKKLRAIFSDSGLVEVFSFVHVRFGKRHGDPLTFVFGEDWGAREIQVEATRKLVMRVVHFEGDVDADLRHAVVSACVRMSVFLFRREGVYRDADGGSQPELRFRKK